MVLLDFGTGLRRGELSGVKWEDINFEEKKLTFIQSIVTQHVGPVKTEKSRTSIPLDEDLLEEVLAWRRARRRISLQCQLGTCTGGTFTRKTINLASMHYRRGRDDHR